MSRSPPSPEKPSGAPSQRAHPSSERAWIGRVIGGKYEVEAVLGSGGMGVVLKARHLRLDEPVAIKVLHKNLVSDPDMTARMIREARAALRLSSEHIVRVMDVDVLDDTIPYLVLEYLEGIDLASHLKRHGNTLPMEEAVAIADQACRALTEAHSLGIIHRDLKPANLFIVTRPDGRRIVKLLDFGISKISTSRDNPITRRGDILGSPRYMSPEQVRGDALDGRADLWSLGIVLYEALSGTSPFLAPNFAATCTNVMSTPHEPLGNLRPDLPPGLVATIDRCLEKDRERRFPDAETLRDVLAPFGPPAPRSASQVWLPEMESHSIETSVPMGAMETAPPSRTPGSQVLTAELLAASPDGSRDGQQSFPRVFFWVAAAGLGIGLIVGIAMLVLGQSRGGETATSKSAAETLPTTEQPASPTTAAALAAPSATTNATAAAPGDAPSATASESSTASALPSATSDDPLLDEDEPSLAGPVPPRPKPAGATKGSQPGNKLGPDSDDPFGERRR